MSGPLSTARRTAFCNGNILHRSSAVSSSFASPSLSLPFSFNKGEGRDMYISPAGKRLAEELITDEKKCLHNKTRLSPF